LFHTKKEEQLEKIARQFFNRRWASLNTDTFKSLAVSRFLAASIVAEVVQRAFRDTTLIHYPSARLLSSVSPMFASGSKLWIGYRFFSEDAYFWARRAAGNASTVVALYFADTKYQFKTDLPPGAHVRSIAELDAIEVGGEHDEYIRILLRGLELPQDDLNTIELQSIIRDVHEALVALKRPCASKAVFRYQLACAVVLKHLDRKRAASRVCTT
jgi:hypothetical protein